VRQEEIHREKRKNTDMGRGMVYNRQSKIINNSKGSLRLAYENKFSCFLDWIKNHAFFRCKRLEIGPKNIFFLFAGYKRGKEFLFCPP
jgi:hypothetical protein